MTHPLDDLTDDERTHAPAYAVSWLESDEQCTLDQMPEAEGVATTFAKALLTVIEERAEVANYVLQLAPQALGFHAMRPVVEAAKVVHQRLAVTKDCRFTSPISDIVEATHELVDAVDAYLASPQPVVVSVEAELRAKVARLTKERDEVRAERDDLIDALILGPLHGKTTAETIAALTSERDALIVRRDELLAAMVRIANETPFADEANQVPTLIAKVGTLKAENEQLRQLARDAYRIMGSTKYDRESWYPEWKARMFKLVPPVGK